MSLAFYDQSVEQHYGKECLKVSNHHDKFCHHGHCGSGDKNVFSFSSDLTRPRDQKV